VEAVRRWDARRRSPSARAVRNAGPPTRWLVIASVLSLIPVVLLFAAGVDNVAALFAMPFLAFVIVGRLDRDGWRLRLAMAELAIRQRARWTWGTLPVDPVSAESWLAAHPDAPPDARASVLATAGRYDDARALLAAAKAEAPVDVVRLARLRVAFAAEDAGDPSIADALETLDRVPELGDLPPDERRYQRLSLAWSIAWLRIRSGAAWRDELAAVVRAFAPFRVPMRVRLFLLIQQYALAISYGLALAIVGTITLLIG
jgi:hypothetical protein